MENPKSISPEILGLFGTIRQQAHEYNRAFEHFQKESLEFARQNSQLQSLVRDSERRSADTILQLNSAVSTALLEIQQKAESIEGLYNELNTIHELKSSLEKLYLSFEERNAELSFVIDSIKSLVQKQVDKEFSKSEKRVEIAMSQMSNQIVSHDQRIWGLQDQQRRSHSLLSDEIDNFKSKVTETKFIVDETTRIVETMIDKAEREMDDKIRKVKTEIENQATQVKLSIEANNRPDTGSDNFESQKQRLLALNNQISTLESKYSALLWSTCIFGLIILGILAAVVFNVF
ncbi:MAG: hypothetical protein IPM69_07095 [Ignavibacteria bacterium]|nr:hypothetical protein [Ignavibacteria bacterium]